MCPDEPENAERPQAAKGRVTVHQLSSLQQVTARRVAEAKATIPHLYLEAEMDMTVATEAHGWLGSTADPGEAAPTVNDLVIRAAALALRESPRLNGAYRDGAVETYSRVNVGFAVATQDSFLTPTIFDADLKNVPEIAAQTRELAAKARSGQITAPELAGGTFTVSNLGMYGISNFGPAISPMQAATLGVGQIRAKQVIQREATVIRQIMHVTLGCDHRIVNGVHGAQFLERLRNLLEDPVGLAG